MLVAFKFVGELQEIGFKGGHNESVKFVKEGELSIVAFTVAKFI